MGMGHGSFTDAAQRKFARGLAGKLLLQVSVHQKEDHKSPSNHPTVAG